LAVTVLAIATTAPAKTQVNRALERPFGREDKKDIIDKQYPMDYNQNMIEIRQTEEYRKWFRGLHDKNARARIDIRIRRMSLGNPGDVKPVGDGISEIRIDYGPGYRVYFLNKNNWLVILIAGGDKRTQELDIRKSKEIARNLEDQ
jgi:putative addiction module killer protein